MSAPLPRLALLSLLLLAGAFGAAFAIGSATAGEDGGGTSPAPVRAVEPESSAPAIPAIGAPASLPALRVPKPEQTAPQGGTTAPTPSQPDPAPAPAPTQPTPAPSQPPPPPPDIILEG